MKTMIHVECLADEDIVIAARVIQQAKQAARPGEHKYVFVRPGAASAGCLASLRRWCAATNINLVDHPAEGAFSLEFVSP
jgi:hypothetical protein